MCPLPRPQELPPDPFAVNPWEKMEDQLSPKAKQGCDMWGAVAPAPATLAVGIELDTEEPDVFF